ncbi:LppP/LprE family lipoprotein, partial [Tsukamurella soli]
PAGPAPSTPTVNPGGPMIPLGPGPVCLQVPAERVAAAVATLPRAFPDAPWRVTAQGSTVGCALDWVQVSPQGATGSSPTRILFFDHDRYVGPATPKATAFTSVVGVGRGEVTVRYRWIVGNEPDADPHGLAYVRFALTPQHGVRALDPIPAQVHAS